MTTDPHDMEHSSHDAANGQPHTAPRLSKAWTVESAHVPIYTGGKISPCYLKRAENPTEKNEEKKEQIVESTIIPCLALPVSGDVAIIDAERGVKLGSVRSNTETSGNKNNDEEEDDGIDADAITAFALSPTQNCLVTCTHNHLLQQYSFNRTVQKNCNQDSNSVVFSLLKSWGRSGHALPVTSMQFHKSGVFLATGSVDGSVRIWDARGGHITHVFRPLAGGSGGGSGRLSVSSFRWLEDTVHLVIAIARDDGSIAIHDLRDKDMKNVVVLRDHMSAVTCMEWWWKGDKDSPGSYPAMFVTAGRDAVLNLWQINEIDHVKQNKQSHKKKRKQTQLATRESEFLALKVAAYERKQTLPLYEQVEGMVLPRIVDDAYILVVATAGSKGVVRLWKSEETESGQMSGLAAFAEQPVGQAYGEARGGYLGMTCIESAILSNADQHEEPEALQQLVVADAEHSLSFLSLGSTEEQDLDTIRTIVGYNDEILDLKVIPNPGAPKVAQIVVATNSAQVRIFDLDTFSCHILDQHTATVLCVDVSPCGRYIATSGKDKKMCLWHTESQKCVAVAVGHTEAVGATALSKKAARYDVHGKTARNGAGSFAVTASLDRTLKRWNLPGHAVLEKYTAADAGETMSLDSFASARAHEKDINVVSVAPNDALIATGSQDKTVKLWKSTDLSLVATLKGHRRGVWDCQFSPFDRVVATASGDRSIRLWSLSDYSCVRTFQGHVASVLRVRFLNGGLQLVSSGADSLIKIWTIRTNECEATMDGHSDKVWALDVAPVSTTMISGSADSQLLVWRDTTEEAEDEKRALREESILMDQQLANHLRHKEFSQALDIALKLDKPRLALKVISSIIETDVKERRSPIYSLQKYIPTWSMERVAQVLQYCREWNTRARNSDVAMFVVRATVSVLPAEDLAASDTIPGILAGVTPYAERHFDRLDRLVASSYLFDFALYAAGSIEVSDDEDFRKWESRSKLVLPPAFVEGKMQSGGQALVGSRRNDADSDAEISVVGDSDSSDEGSDEEMNREEDARGDDKQNSAESSSDSEDSSSS